MTFLNRELEKSAIVHALQSRRSELIILYGRRGVGKSALITEVLRDRPHLYYQATTRMLPQQLEDLTSAFRLFVADAILPGILPSIEDFCNALAQVARGRPGEPIVAVIDELPYLAQSDPSVPTVLQRWWDGIRRQGISNLKVFLLGSLVSWMEEHTLSESGPLHNRRTGQLKLGPLSYADAALFYPHYSPDDRVSAYAIWGGMPTYIEEISPDGTLWESVREGILRPGARLADEPSWLRFADLRNDALYSSTLRAIAQGAHRPSRIAQAVGKGRADEIHFQIERLRDLGLVVRVVPIHQEQQQRSSQALYRLADHYVAFWYRFVDRLRHLLGLGRIDDALQQIRDRFDPYVAEQAFEDVCQQFLWRAVAIGRLPVDLSFDAVGSWWVAREDVQDQIDVVAMREGKTVLVGECKWSRQPVDQRDLAGLGAALRRASSDLDPIDRPWRALFSRSGFSSDLIALGRDPAERLLLVQPEDLY